MTETKFRIEQAKHWLDFCELDPSASTFQAMTPYLQLYLNNSSLLAVSLRHQCDGMPIVVWHGVVRQYQLPANVDAVALTKDINDGELDELLSRIVDGAETYWDGSNWKGRLNEDAAEAEEELRDRLYSDCAYTIPGGGLYEADVWFVDNEPIDLDITADTTDEALAAFAKEQNECALDEGARVIGIEDHFRRLRDSLREDREDALAVGVDKYKTTCSDGLGRAREAIQLPWATVNAILGHKSRGSHEEDETLVAALLEAGAPAWVEDPHDGWVDEHGWGLMGPKAEHEQDDA